MYVIVRGHEHCDKYSGSRRFLRLYNELCKKKKAQEVSSMKDDRQEKLKISNDLLDAMLVGVRTQEDLWGKEGIITQINKALLERILNAPDGFPPQ